MKDISVKHSQKTETVDFGPIGRDVILNKKIEDETARATNRENELQAQITEAGARVKDVKYNGTSIVVDKVAEIKPSIEASVAVETARAEAAEGTLQTNITNEVTRAQGAETTLTNNLAAEVTNRQTGDTTLQNNIDNEAFVRQSADTALQANLEIEVNARINAITAEATTRAAFDDSLANEILLEEETRATEDTRLSDRIDSLESRGRFLSTWNATTGLPSTYPPIPETVTELTYTYNFRAGDYYIIHNVGTSNKKPTGSSIQATRTEIGQPWTWTITSAEETESVSNNGTYTYDGTNWVLMGAGAAAAWGSIGGNIADQEDLSTALTSKVDLTSEQTITGTKTFNGASYFNGNVYIPASVFQTHDIQTHHIKPATNSDYILGDSNHKWSAIYGNTIYVTTTNTTFAEVGALTLTGQLKAGSEGSAGTSGQVLTSNGADAAPTWQTPTAPVPSNMVTTNTEQTITGTKYMRDLHVSQTSGNIPRIYFNLPTSLTTREIGLVNDSGTIELYTDANFVPNVTNSQTLGTNTTRWSTVYTSNIANQNISIPVDSIVTKDTIQTITGGKTFNSGGITIENSGGVSKIRFTGNSSWGSASFGVGGMARNKPYIEFNGHIAPTASGENRSLGLGDRIWANTYTTKISDGTNEIPVANIATKSTESTETTGQLKIAVVTALPENPDANTLYFIKEA